MKIRLEALMQTRESNWKVWKAAQYYILEFKDLAIQSRAFI
jgi:hypothetical protein